MSRVDDLEQRVEALEQRLTEYVEMFARDINRFDLKVDEVNKRITAEWRPPKPADTWQQPPSGGGTEEDMR